MKTRNENFPFAAFITNLGKYNEGFLVGEWVRFPTTSEEMKEVFKRIGIGSKNEFGNVYEEWFITDYDCYVDGLNDYLDEYSNLNELNYLASLIDDMKDYEYDVFEAALELGDMSNILDVINLTSNLDCYVLLSEVNDDDDLGRYYIEECGCYDLSSMGNLANYIDYESFGRDVRFDQTGMYTNNGYIYTTGDSFSDIYDGTKEDIPEEYLVYGLGEDGEDE